MDGRVEIAEQTNRVVGKHQEWAGARSDYPRHQSVADRFEEMALQHAGRLAIVHDGESLTYAQLNARANHLAHRLRSLQVGSESAVGVCLERSPELIIALLGILKAGGAYVPFDATYPAARLDLMLAETRPAVMITNHALAARVLREHQVQVVLMDDEAPLAGTETNPPRMSGSAELAYVMYTSGSTGKPKGVMVENRSIVRLVVNTHYCRFAADEVFLQFAPISFDASTFEIWGALLNGATLAIMPAGSSSLSDLGEAIRRHGVTTLWLTAGLFHLFVDERLADLRPLKQLLAGGDSLSAAHVRRALDGLPNTTIINGYGPTEGTTFTCCHSMRVGDPVPNSVPIGRPIANTFAYILNDALEPVGAGEQGELYAGGDGVARGYLNAPGLTAERFLPDPFSSDPAARMYRTGDLARWREDGTIEFLGRVDNQVKVLGHRIEPGEVEAALLETGLQQACVVAESRESAKRLLAYVVGRGEAETLKSYLEAKLPAYMVPAHFVFLPALPLDPNGKVDRQALARTVPSPATAQTQAEAGNDTQSLLLRIWSAVLHLESVGLDDNFFDLGGDSLLLVAVHSRLQKQLGRSVPVTDLFEFTTIRTLAHHLDGAPRHENKTSDAVAAAEQPAQKRRDAFARFRAVKGGAQ